MMATFPAWNTVATTVSFYGTTILLGSVFGGLAITLGFNRAKKKDSDFGETQNVLPRNTVKWLSITAVLALGIVIIAMALSIGMWSGDFVSWLVFRLVLAFVGVGLLVAFSFKNAAQANQELKLNSLVYGAIALVFASELIGRLLFYATSASISI